MPLFREALTCSCPSDLSLKLNKYASSSLPLTFLMGRVFFTIFNIKREINKKKITSWKKYPIFEELYLGNCWTHKV
jgi:hypothetical protein